MGNYKSDIAWSDLSVDGAVRHWARITPNAAALLNEDNQILSYRQLTQGMDDVRRQLHAAGFGIGHRVAIAHPNEARLALLWLGVMSCATAVPLSPVLTIEEYCRDLTDRRVDGLIVPRGEMEVARKAAKRMTIPVLDLTWSTPSLDAALQLSASHKKGNAYPRQSTPDDIALVLSTSGTTAQSKIVPLRHKTLIAQFRNLGTALEMTTDDRILNLNPLYLLSGIANTATSLIFGGSVATIPSLEVGRLFPSIDALQPTVFNSSFGFLKQIIHYARENPSEVRRGRIRVLRPTAGKIDRNEADAMEEIFGAPIIEAYGMTECGRSTSNPMPPGLRKLGTVGVPVNDCEIAILGEDGGFLSSPEKGEIVIRGNNVFEGYENNDEANRNAFHEGWYRTGDVGFLDEDGYLTITGRLKEMINRGGEKISPSEIDSVLMRHPDIADVATFAIPHRSLGEIVGAAIVLAAHANTNPNSIRGFANVSLSPIKRPSAFLYVDEIPRTKVGKVKRIELAAHFKRAHLSKRSDLVTAELP